MALKITFNSGVYKIKGDLKEQNLNSFVNYFNSLISTHPKKINLLIKKNQEIDATGISVLQFLLNKAKENHVVFKVLSKSKTITKLFREE